MHDECLCLDDVKHSQKLAGSLYSFILPTFVHLTDRLAQLCTLCMSSNLGMPSEEKVRMRISCGPNQLHLIHGKPVGSPYCFLIVSPGLPPPYLHGTLHQLRNKGWFVHLYIQLQWIILTTKKLIDQNKTLKKWNLQRRWPISQRLKLKLAVCTI